MKPYAVYNVYLLKRLIGQAEITSHFEYSIRIKFVAVIDEWGGTLFS